MQASRISIPIDPANVQEASNKLDQAFEKLGAERKRITKVHYPPRFADKLGIAEQNGNARCYGRLASPNYDVPYVIVIEYED